MFMLVLFEFYVVIVTCNGTWCLTAEQCLSLQKRGRHEHCLDEVCFIKRSVCELHLQWTFQPVLKWVLCKSSEKFNLSEKKRGVGGIDRTVKLRTG